MAKMERNQIAELVKKAQAGDSEAMNQTDGCPDAGIKI